MEIGYDGGFDKSMQLSHGRPGPYNVTFRNITYRESDPSEIKGNNYSVVFDNVSIGGSVVNNLTQAMITDIGSNSTVIFYP